MNNKVCEKCGNIINEGVSVCPNCNNKVPNGQTEFNIVNPFIINNSNNINQNNVQQASSEKEIKDTIPSEKNIENNEKPSGSSIIFYNNNNNSTNNNVENKTEIKNSKSDTHKKKKKKSDFFAFLILIQAIILLLIIIFSTLIEKVLPVFCHYMITVMLLMISFNFVYRYKKVGYILTLIGSVLMIFMIIERDYISTFMGFVIFVTSIMCLLKNGR